MTPSISVRWSRSVPVPPDTDRRALGTVVRRAVRSTLRDAGVASAVISVALVDDRKIAALNREWLGHEGPTDVLSFPLYEAGDPPVGDIYIGVEEAVRQAAVHGIAPREELIRLAVHGTLHVLGHDHPDGEARLTSPMWRTQERLVAEVLGS